MNVCWSTLCTSTKVELSTQSLPLMNTWTHAEHIGTKTAVQIRSHAQKFFSKLQREQSVSGGTMEGEGLWQVDKRDPLNGLKVIWRKGSGHVKQLRVYHRSWIEREITEGSACAVEVPLVLLLNIVTPT